jgi:hypothetical protein
VGISNNLNGKHILHYRLCTIDKAELVQKERGPGEPKSQGFGPKGLKCAEAEEMTPRGESWPNADKGMSLGGFQAEAWAGEGVARGEGPKGVGKGSEEPRELEGHTRSKKEARRGQSRSWDLGMGIGDGARLGEAWGGEQMLRTEPGGSGKGAEGSGGGAEGEQSN